MRLGLVGCGALGGQIARAVVAGRVRGVRLAGVHDRDSDAAERLAASLHPRPRILTLAALARACDLVVEAAGVEAVPGVARACLAASRPLLVMSVGALLLQPGLAARFRRAGLALRAPSGALAGLDGLRAAALGGLRRVELVTRKPPGGLGRRGGGRAVTLFAGSAREAVRLFPRNINVAAAAALAGLGADATRVRIVADPRVRRNTHHLTALGAFGRMEVRVENLPSPENPRTSVLAGLSALAAIADQADVSAKTRRRRSGGA